MRTKKELSRILKCIENLRKRVEVLECRHINTKLESKWISHSSMNFTYMKICTSCDKVLETYNKQDYYKEKIKEHKKQLKIYEYKIKKK